MSPEVLLKRSIQIALVALLAYLAVLGSFFLYPPLYVIYLAIRQDSSLCSIAESFQGARSFLNQRRETERVASESRFLEEDSEGYQLWSTPAGDWWIPSGSEQALPILVVQQEMDSYGGSDWGVREGDVVLDCGAHIGLFTKKALSMGARRVVAIEPSPKNLECLRRNLKDEISQGKVVVVPKGVWDQEDELILHTYDANSAADSFVVQAEGSTSEVSVPLTTIDQLVKDLDLEDVDLIKMDIKGAAHRALQGSEDTIREHTPRLVISTEEKEDHPADIASWIESFAPDYEPSCGLCALDNYEVYPLVLFFR
jgi:FkbM family methyltransferase